MDTLMPDNNPQVFLRLVSLLSSQGCHRKALWVPGLGFGGSTSPLNKQVAEELGRRLSRGLGPLPTLPSGGGSEQAVAGAGHTGTSQPETSLQKHRLAKPECLSGAPSICGLQLRGDFRMTDLTGHVDPSPARSNNWDYICPQRLARRSLGQIKWSSLPGFEYIMWLYFSHLESPIH